MYAQPHPTPSPAYTASSGSGHNTVGQRNMSGRVVGRNTIQQLTCRSCMEGKTFKNFEKMVVITYMELVKYLTCKLDLPGMVYVL